VNKRSRQGQHEYTQNEAEEAGKACRTGFSWSEAGASHVDLFVNQTQDASRILGLFMHCAMRGDGEHRSSKPFSCTLASHSLDLAFAVNALLEADPVCCSALKLLLLRVGAGSAQRRIVIIEYRWVAVFRGGGVVPEHE
jgi:hypothetical protein